MSVFETTNITVKILEKNFSIKRHVISYYMRLSIFQASRISTSLELGKFHPVLGVLYHYALSKMLFPRLFLLKNSFCIFFLFHVLERRELVLRDKSIDTGRL